MIVRVHGSGQYRLDDAARSELDRLDEEIVAAVDRKDIDAAHAALRRASALVRQRGTCLPDDDLSPSDLILPDADAPLDELQTEIQSLVHTSE